MEDTLMKWMKICNNAE